MSAAAFGQDGAGMPDAVLLPELRAELRLLPGPDDSNGVPSWNIFDPVRNRYFRIGWAAFELLSRWHLGDAATLLAKLRADSAARANLEDVDAMSHFLRANSLTRESASGSIDDFVKQRRAAETRGFKWLLQNYLFIRVPLFRPEALLDRMLPVAERVYTRSGALCFSALGVVGLLLISRQWDVFWSTLLHFFTWQGFALYGLAQVAVKIVHELGHALLARRFGCRVPVMGVALMVLYPVMYTDTTDAWKLVSRRERLWIGAGGLLNEFGVAVVATLAWCVLPDGALRSAAFLLATAGWMMSLVVNLNPFMRFDGYYLLADYLGVENLQERAFAYGRWKLRELLFAAGEASPGRERPELRTVLALYAWGTWIYRFFLFMGIALLVYHFAVKVVGVALFVVELGVFLAIPIRKEIAHWWKERRRYFATRRGRFSLLVAFTALVLAVLPWRSSVLLPAVLDSADRAWVFATEPGRITRVHVSTGARVEAGQLLLELESPSLEHEIRTTRMRIAGLEVRSRRGTASEEERAERQVLAQQFAEEASRMRGLEARREALAIRAPISGWISDLAEPLHGDQWVPRTLPLLFVAGEGAEIQAFAREDQLRRVEAGVAARFIPQVLAGEAVEAQVVAIDVADLGALAQPALASNFGGPIAVRTDPRTQKLVPERSTYRVRVATLPGAGRIHQSRDGMLRVEGTPESLVARLFSKTVALVVRESGF